MNDRPSSATTISALSNAPLVRHRADELRRAHGPEPSEAPRDVAGGHAIACEASCLDAPSKVFGTALPGGRARGSRGRDEHQRHYTTSQTDPIHAASS